MTQPDSIRMYNLAEARAAKEAYEALPTLNMLRASCKRENLAPIRAALIAKNLGVSQATVDRQISKLRSLHLIEPDADKKIDISNWRICPYLAWRGNANSMLAYLCRLPEKHPWITYNDEQPL